MYTFSTKLGNSSSEAKDCVGAVLDCLREFVTAYSLTFIIPYGIIAFANGANVSDIIYHGLSPLFKYIRIHQVYSLEDNIYLKM